MSDLASLLEITDGVTAPAYLIRKRGVWYRPNSAGYTNNIAEAGRYTLAEAEAITHPNGPDGPRDNMSYELAPALSPPIKAGEAVPERVTEIIVEPFTDSVVLLLIGDGETLSAICDVACATELRDKLSAALYTSPPPEAYGVKVTDKMVDDAFDGYLSVANIPYIPDQPHPKDALRVALSAALSPLSSPQPEAAADRISTLERELEEARAAVEQLRGETYLASAEAAEFHRDNAVTMWDAERARATAAEAKVARMGEALKKARVWHESEEKALSKQPPSYGPNGNEWARLEHKEQMAEIDAALQSEKDREGQP